MARIKTAVLFSGRGSNPEAVDAAAKTDFPAEITQVISNVQAQAVHPRRPPEYPNPSIIDLSNNARREEALHAELCDASMINLPSRIMHLHKELRRSLAQ